MIEMLKDKQLGLALIIIGVLANRLRDQGILDYNQEYLCVRKFEEVALLIES